MMKKDSFKPFGVRAGAVVVGAALLLSGCFGNDQATSVGLPSPDASPSPTADTAHPPADGGNPGGEAPQASPSPDATAPSPTASTEPNRPASPRNGDAVETAANAEAITVLVNKRFKLPDGYEPDDLVYPNVRFSFSEKIEKRMLRKEAASALEELFAAAERDGVILYGVSGYRSYSRQKAIYESNVQTQGEELANKYSARPGHSEHQTGLAIDVSSESVNFALDESFASTKEGRWLADHAHEFGFIIRYPKGKEDITGYNYEPWHIRYVGKEMAADIYEKGVTLEEYLLDADPVSN